MVVDDDDITIYVWRDYFALTLSEIPGHSRSLDVTEAVSRSHF